MCPLPTVIRPTPPGVIPRYNQLDETTNLHVTSTMKEIDRADTGKLPIDKRNFQITIELFSESSTASLKKLRVWQIPSTTRLMIVGAT